jgi:tetratricopeptide (TPR) repeat protein
MKAAHRKELHTNILADKLGHLYTKARSSTSIILWALAAVVVLCMAFWWWSNRAVSANSLAWEEYWLNRDSLTGLESTAERFKGTAAERAIKLAEADRLYDDAYNTFFRSPTEARGRFQQAFEAYQQLAANPGNCSDVAVRALLGSAKCREWLGDVEQARHFYAQVVEKHGSHPLADNAG